MLADSRLGRYKIVRKIGEGGMGEVYLAEDTKLSRRVALKTLPADMATDSERMLRFEHEAKSASALNHPNIITIYEINDDHDTPFIAMEYVEGETLATKIKNKKLDLQKTLDIGTQIASALTAAHEAEVIHRDIKPDNVIIRPDGLVKVLDFGLAKLAENPSAVDLETQTTAFVLTSPGLVMGTVGYMSPEQARGKSVDARSDIFSFGTMLYEMLSGKRPFGGENDVDVLGSILHKEPAPLSNSGAHVPHEVESLIRKTLRKDRDERYQTVRELLADLRDLREELNLETTGEQVFSTNSGLDHVKRTDDTMAKPLTTAGKSKITTNSIREVVWDEVKLHPIGAAATMAMIVISIAAVAWGISNLNQSEGDTDPFQTMRFAKLTSTGNVASGQVAVSPDGKLIAYVIQEAGEQSLWVKQSATASNVRIIAPADVNYKGVIFSPDAAYIYYAASEKMSAPSIYQVPALGGSPRRLIVDAAAPISLTPDGTRLSFVRKESSLMSANIDGGDVQTITKLSNGKAVKRTSWSPAGNTIVAAVFAPEDSKDHLVEINVMDGSERQFPSPQWLRLSGIAWLPDSTSVIVTGRDPDTQLSQIWRVSYPDGRQTRVTNDLNSYEGVSMTIDGQSLVSTRHELLANLWVGEPRESNKAIKITSEVGKDEGLSGVAWAPNEQIVYTTRIKGMQDLWIVNRDGSENRQLTYNAQVNHSPAVSPNGRYIVFVSTRAGSPSIWRTEIDGENPVQLTDSPGIELAPSISPDSNWVVYEHEDDNHKTTVWKVNMNGGKPQQLTNVKSARPVVSPDGQFVACEFGEAMPISSVKLGIIPIDGRELARILDLPMVLRSRVFRWAVDGKALIYSNSRDRIDNLWSQPLDGGAPKQLTDFKSDRIFRFDVSANDGQFVFARGSDSSDAVMISNFR